MSLIKPEALNFLGFKLWPYLNLPNPRSLKHERIPHPLQEPRAVSFPCLQVLGDLFCPCYTRSAQWRQAQLPHSWAAGVGFTVEGSVIRDSGLRGS